MKTLFPKTVRHRKLQLEPLEERQMLAVSPLEFPANDSSALISPVNVSPLAAPVAPDFALPAAAAAIAPAAAPLVTAASTGLDGLTLNITANNFNELNIQYNFANVTAITNCSITVTGVTLDFANCIELTNTSLTANGGVMKFPKLTTYTPSNSSSVAYRTLSATGSGGLLDFPVLTTIDANAYRYVTITATTGGKVNLSKVQWVNYANLNVQSGSEIDLSALPTLGASGSMEITTSGDGKIKLGTNITQITNVTIPAAAFANLVNFDSSKIMSISNSTLTIGSAFNATRITAITGSNITANGVTLDFANCIELTNTSLTANGGVMKFPKLTTYTPSNSSSVAYRTLSATGSGGLLDFPVLTTIDANAYRYVTITATTGGKVNLSKVISINYANINATGSSSLIDLSSFPATSTGGNVKINATSGGQVLLKGDTPQQTQLATPVNISATSKNATTLTVGWNAVANASGYTIQYSTDPNFLQNVKTQAVSSGTASTADITGLTTGTVYFVKVLATGTGNYTNSLYSLIAFAVLVTTPTETPSTIVTTLSDIVNPNDGLISLREAIMYAGTNGLGTTITFASNLSGTAVLSSEILIDKSVTIAGPGNISAGNSKIVLSGNKQSRIFNIQPGSGTIDVTVSGLALTSGNTDSDGGAIRAAKTNLTLTNLNVYGNTATSGGAVFQDGGSLVINGSVFNANRASQNGGHIAFQNGTVSIQSNSTLLGGTARNGGAVFAKNATTTFGTMAFNNNMAVQYGGGFYQEGGVSNFYGAVSFTGNKGQFGGGMSVLDGSVNMPGNQNILFSGNQADGQGGGLYVKGTAKATPVNLTNVTFSNNSIVNGNGGAIAIQGSLVSLSVTNGTFTKNSGNYGSAVYQQNAASSFTDCKFDSNVGSRQGTVFADGGSLALTRTNFVNNQTNANAGLYIYNATAVLTDTTFTGGKTVNPVANAIVKYPSGSLTIKSGSKTKTFDAALTLYLNEGEDWFN